MHCAREASGGLLPASPDLSRGIIDLPSVCVSLLESSPLVSKLVAASADIKSSSDAAVSPCFSVLRPPSRNLLPSAIYSAPSAPPVHQQPSPSPPRAPRALCSRPRPRAAAHSPLPTPRPGHPLLSILGLGLPQSPPTSPPPPTLAGVGRAPPQASPRPSSLPPNPLGSPLLLALPLPLLGAHSSSGGPARRSRSNSGEGALPARPSPSQPSAAAASTWSRRCGPSRAAPRPPTSAAWSGGAPPLDGRPWSAAG